jgi:hypothetical protein
LLGNVTHRQIKLALRSGHFQQAAIQVILAERDLESLILD